MKKQKISKDIEIEDLVKIIPMFEMWRTNLGLAGKCGN
jgi:hypothetical protein